MNLGNANIILLVALFLGCGWVIVARFRSRPDINSPLFFYLALFSFHFSNPLALNPYVVYIAVVMGLFLRFEFMNEKLAVLLKVIEVLCLLQLLYSFGLLVLGSF